MRTPFKHQIEGKDFIVEKRNVILADEMGLGKTFTTIMATLELGNGGVVICPASLKNNWAREILMVDDDADIQIIDGGETRVYHQGNTSKWLIVNYDVISRDVIKEKILDFMPTTLILDEAHYIKSSSTKRTRTALEIAKQASHVLLLTGTPILNRPMELFTLLKAIGHPLGANWYGYAKTYCGAHFREFWRKVDDGTGRMVARKVKFLDTGGATNLDKLAIALKTVYLRRTKEVLGDTLPEKIITNLEVEIAPEYRKAYKQAWDDYMEYLLSIPDEEQDKNIQNIQLAKHLIELNKLKQVASQGKVPHVLKDVGNIVEQGGKVIIFTQYTNTLHEIVRGVQAMKIKVVKLNGEDDMEARQKAVDRFQEDDSVKVFVANIKAGGVGITLTKANKVLFADMEWTPALHSQAEDRAHRIGQHNLVNVYYYIAKDTVDEDIVDLLGKKSQIIQHILEGKAGKLDNKNITKDAIARIQEREGVIHR